MKYYSTRDKEKKAPFTISDAVLKGLCPDGGLFVPENLVKIKLPSSKLSYPEFAAEVLSPFFEGDELEGELLDICKEAFNFPIVLNPVSTFSVLELFHGPTSAFKDFGARFLSCTMERILRKRGEKLTILVATSGDTGGAVASAFHNRENLSVKILFPKGRVSERQKKQLTVFDNNVSSYEVDGNFDDCQKMVKDAFMDPYLTGLSSANSINLARLLPQMVYYVYSSLLHLELTGKPAHFIIPSGNIGNSTAAYWALEMGAPIRKITLAVNENKSVVDYLSTGVYEPRKSIQTLANAMDVGAPSNIERLFYIYPTFNLFKSKVEAYSVSDDEIRETIKDTYENTGYVICPHTATAVKVYYDHFKGEDAIMVSTAHPAKFETIVEPVIGKNIPVPQSLEELLNKESRVCSIKADYKKLFV